MQVEELTEINTSPFVDMQTHMHVSYSLVHSLPTYVFFFCFLFFMFDPLFISLMVNSYLSLFFLPLLSPPPLAAALLLLFPPS